MPLSINKQGAAVTSLLCRSVRRRGCTHPLQFLTIPACRHPFSFARMGRLHHVTQQAWPNNQGGEMKYRFSATLASALLASVLLLGLPLNETSAQGKKMEDAISQSKK